MKETLEGCLCCSGIVFLLIIITGVIMVAMSDGVA